MPIELSTALLTLESTTEHSPAPCLYCAIQKHIHLLFTNPFCTVRRSIDLQSDTQFFLEREQELSSLILLKININRMLYIHFLLHYVLQVTTQVWKSGTCAAVSLCLYI